MANKSLDDLHPLKTMIDCCKVLKNDFSSYVIQHVYRETNMVADSLSKYRLCSVLGVEYFKKPPPWVSKLLLDDLGDCPRFREVAMAT